mmetsp:Transcript_56657/g.113765  ORF Transcript_56657/g.113765 Transcript_56657/m.113765 type:complete len:198 (-) Transcript_56657:351-944(-)
MLIAASGADTRDLQDIWGAGIQHCSGAYARFGSIDIMLAVVGRIRAFLQRSPQGSAYVSRSTAPAERQRSRGLASALTAMQRTAPASISLHLEANGALLAGAPLQAVGAVNRAGELIRVDDGTAWCTAAGLGDDEDLWQRMAEECRRAYLAAPSSGPTLAAMLRARTVRAAPKAATSATTTAIPEAIVAQETKAKAD